MNKLTNALKYLSELKEGDKFAMRGSDDIKTFIKYKATNYEYSIDSGTDGHRDYDEAFCDILIYTKEDKHPIKDRMYDSFIKVTWNEKDYDSKFHELAGRYVVEVPLTVDNITDRLEIGDYISFTDDSVIIYKVLDIDSDKGYVLYYDDEAQRTLWERFEYITSIFKINEEIEVYRN